MIERLPAAASRAMRVDQVFLRHFKRRGQRGSRHRAVPGQAHLRPLRLAHPPRTAGENRGTSVTVAFD
ncbi:MAG: hypothetical protein MZW92_15175 [Comamonadaceae bacterium]|nr:hypothetical protein [Comamonadaceae bacterium]